MEARHIEGTNLVLMHNFDMKYQIGDIVRLRSGGPNSTVIACDRDNVEVQWYIDLALHGATHPVAAVVLVEEFNANG